MDIFSPEVLDSVTRVMPPQTTFFKKTFFGKDKCEPNTEVRADFYKGKRRVAPFVSENSKAKTVTKIGYSSEKFETPLVKVKDVTTIEDLVKRLPGELVQNSGFTPEGRAIQLLAETLQDFNEQISRREEVMCVQALMTGKIPVIGENVNYTIDFGFTNKSTLSTLWDAQNSTADPIKDLSAAVLVCMKNGYRKPNICVMERSAYDAFIARCTALGYLNQRNYLDLSIEPSVKNENLTYCGRLRDPNLEIYLYDEWYIDDWSAATPTEKPMIDKGKVLLASSNARFSMYYGVLTFTDENTKSFRSFMATRGTDSWVEKEPAQRFITLNSRPLPVPHEVDSWYVLTVSSTT